jgi:hypothetical protein
VNGNLIINVEMVCFIIKMAINMMANGQMTKKMVMVFFIV